MLKSKLSRLLFCVAIWLSVLTGAFVSNWVGIIVVIALAGAGVCAMYGLAYDWMLRGDEELSVERERQSRERGLDHPPSVSQAYTNLRRHYTKGK